MYLISTVKDVSHPPPPPFTPKFFFSAIVYFSNLGFFCPLPKKSLTLYFFSPQYLSGLSPDMRPKDQIYFDLRFLNSLASFFKEHPKRAPPGSNGDMDAPFLCPRGQDTSYRCPRRGPTVSPVGPPHMRVSFGRETRETPVRLCCRQTGGERVGL